jgi:hypothetical protein
VVGGKVKAKHAISPRHSKPAAVIAWLAQALPWFTYAAVVHQRAAAREQPVVRRGRHHQQARCSTAATAACCALLVLLRGRRQLRPARHKDGAPARQLHHLRKWRTRGDDKKM